MYTSTGLQPFMRLQTLFSFLICNLVRRTHWKGDQRVAHTGQHKQNKCKLTSMPEVVLEPTIPVFERTKRVHASDRAATVIGIP
jgi:hypothetical protein